MAGVHCWPAGIAGGTDNRKPDPPPAPPSEKTAPLCSAAFQRTLPAPRQAAAARAQSCPY